MPSHAVSERKSVGSQGSYNQEVVSKRTKQFKRLVGLVDKGILEELNMYSLAEQPQWGATVGGGGGRVTI